MKKLTTIVLSFIIAASSFVSISAKDNNRTNEGSKIEFLADNDAKIVSFGGWHESLYIIWENDTDVKNTKVYYKKTSENDYKQADSELIRPLENGARADIVGISAGNYDVKVVLSNGTELIRNNITADNYDRSGYAFFNNETLGGYNADGTPKSDADIIYVTNETKNSITYNGKTGIGNILTNASKASKPIIVRFIGTVDTQTRDSDGTKTTDKNNGVVAINGLTDRISSGGDDSYFNMCDIVSAKNITLEGIGTDAVIEKWGFTFSKCKYIEVRNLRFTKYPEDACSFLGGGTSSYGSYAWLHNCTFDVGENKYDLTTEQDKHEGDGSTDVAYFNNLTFSYNRFNNCHKTSLNGNSDKVTQYNITWHHNYFNNCGSRLPLIRQANMHSYNNYFYKTTNNCIDSRASAWILSESNYFEDCPSALKTTENKDHGDPIIKSFKDEFDNSFLVDNTGTIYIAEERGKTYSANASANANKNPYPNFDTNTEKFYYKNGVSDVFLLQSAQEAKENCIKNSGVMKADTYTPIVPITESTTGKITETTTEITTETTTEITTESTTESTTETTTESTTEAVTYFAPVDLHDAKAGIILDGASSAGENSVTYREKTNDYYILDRSNNATTTWEVPFDEQSKGTVIIKGKVTPVVESSRWAFLQIRGTTSAGSGMAVASFISNQNKKLCLQTTDETAFDFSIKKNKEYDYKFIIDLDKKNVSLTINGETRVSKIDAESIDEVYFMTAKTAADRDIIATMPNVMKSVVNNEKILRGDVDSDNRITKQDAVITMKYVLDPKSVKLSDTEKICADFDNNDIVDSTDVSKIFQIGVFSD